MAESSSMTSFYARKLIHSPDNTSTFLRGDNTFTNVLEGYLHINSTRPINANGSAALYIGTELRHHLLLDNSSIQTMNDDEVSALTLNPLGGSVLFGEDGFTSYGNAVISSNNNMRQLEITAPAGTMTLYSGATATANRGLSFTNLSGTTTTAIYANDRNDIFFYGTLNGNALTASAWATGRQAYVNLASTNIATINTGEEPLELGVSGVLPIIRGGTGASSTGEAVSNFFSDLSVTTAFTDNSAIIVGDLGQQAVWHRLSGINLWNYISQKTDARYANLVPSNVLIYKGELTTNATPNTTQYTDVPTQGYKIGWAYRVLEDGTFAGQTCKEDELIICIHDGPDTSNVITPTDWYRIKGGITDLSEIFPQGGTDGQLLSLDEHGNLVWISEPHQGTVTSITAGLGLTGGTITSTGTINLQLASNTPLENTSVVVSEVADRVYPVVLDASGHLAVNVPWQFPTINAIDPSIFTEAYQLLYSTSAGTPAVLNANITPIRKFLCMTGDGEVATSLEWDTITKADIGLNNVENIALSTWGGSSNLTTLGTISTGNIPWTLISNKPILNIAGLNLSTDSGTISAGDLRQALGLSTALRFIGVATNDITDGGNEDPLISGYNINNATAGDVIIDGDTHFEYVWTLKKMWERLGGDESYKVIQTAVDSGAIIDNQWISHIAQNANGDITFSVGSLVTSGEWTGNANTATTLKTAREIYVSLINTRNENTPITFDGSTDIVIHVDGILPTAHGGTGINTHTANRIVWSTDATHLQATGNHFINTNKIGVNVNTAPSENFFVNGSARFVSSNPSVTGKGFVIGDSGSFMLSIGANGIQAYNAANTSTLLIQPEDGSIVVGKSTNSSLTASYYGVHDFKNNGGFIFSGITQGASNQEYALWFSTSAGLPYYQNNLTYNPTNGFLTIANNGGIRSGTNENLFVSSEGNLDITITGSIIFNQSVTNTTTELGRFNTAGSLIIGSPLDPNTITAYLLYVDGNTQIMGDLVPGATDTYTLGSSSLRWSSLFIGDANTYGSNTNPIYWNNGVPTPLTYTKNRLYYSASASSFAKTNHYASTTKLAINSTTAPEGAFSVTGNSVLDGTVGISGVTTITNNTDASTNSGALIVTGGANIGAKILVGTDASIGGNLVVTGTSKLTSHVAIGADVSATYALYVNDDSYIKGNLTLTDNIYITTTDRGLYLKDKSNLSYGGIYDNGSELWIGATASSAYHHRGPLYLSAGHTGTVSNNSIYIAIPSNNTNSPTVTTYPLVYKDAAGDTNTPIYTDANGKTATVTNINTSVGGTGVTAHTANRLVWSTSATTIQATDHHYINANKLAIGSTTEPSTNLYVNGSFETTTSGKFGGQLYVNYEQEVGLNSNGSIVIGDKDAANLAFDSNEIMARNNSNAADLYINSDGGTIYTGVGGISTAGAIALSTIGDGITFAATGATGTAGGLSWRGSNDNASIYYTVPSADAGRLTFQTGDDTNCLIAYNYSGTDKAYMNNSIPAFYPATTNTGTLGLGGAAPSRWSRVYIGTADTYGDAYNPIYWNNGVPAAITLTIKMAFSIADGKKGIQLNYNGFKTTSIVTQIVVTNGEANLNAALTWESGAGWIKITTATTTSGIVSGYITVLRGAEIAPTTTADIS